MYNESFYLEQQLIGLIGQSQDPYYSDYLRELLYQLRRGTVSPAYAAGEINRTWQIYQQRLQGRTVQPIQPMMQQPTVTASQQPTPAQPMAAQQPMPAPQMPMQAAGQRWKNTEYTIGASVLGVVGVLFILAAFVMLGMIYMDGMIRGIAMYVIAAAVLAVSELWIVRKLPRFAVGTTGLAICGLYLTTLLNYLYFENFGDWVAVGLTAAISLLSMWVSRKKDSGVIRIISIVGCYGCVLASCGRFLSVAEEQSAGRFVGLVLILLIINLCSVFLPMKRTGNGIAIAHICCNAIFSFLFSYFILFGLGVEKALWYLVSAFLVQGVAYWQIGRRSKSVTGGKMPEDATVIYLIVTAVLLGHFALYMLMMSFDWRLHAVMGGLLAVCSVLFVLFWLDKSVMKWLQYVCFCLAALLVYGWGKTGDTSGYWQMSVVLGVFFSAKLLSRVRQLYPWELAVTVLTGWEAVFFFREPDLLPGLCFLAAFLIALAALHEWKSVYEEITLLVVVAFVCVTFDSEMKFAVVAALLLAAMLCFNSFAFFRDKDSRLANYVNLVLMCLVYLGAAGHSNTVLYTLLLVIGCLFIGMIFREKYGMNFKFRQLIFVLFLCYMTMIWEIPVPLYRSIILMVIAVGSVIAGFCLKGKQLRIAGLVLSLLVCAKLVLYDFASAATTEKMILFLVVGVIALAISGIYIALEKKMV